MFTSCCYLLVLALLISCVEVTMSTRLLAVSDDVLDEHQQRSVEDEPSVDKQDCLTALVAHIATQEEDGNSGLAGHADGNDLRIWRRCNLEVQPPTPGYGSSSSTIPPPYGQSPGPSTLPSPPPSPLEPSSLPMPRSPSPSSPRSPSLSPSPSVAPTSSSPPPSQQDDSEDIMTPPYCEATSSVTCLSVNATRGTILDAFLLTAFGWKSGSATFSSLAYEFGVLANSGAVLVHKPRQPYSGAMTATIAGVMTGKTSLYVCVSSMNRTGLAIVGPRSCRTVDVQVSSTEVSTVQLEHELTAIKNDITSTSSTISTTVDMAKRLAAIASVATTSSSTASVAILASDLLGKLVALPGNDTSSTSPVLMVFDGISTIWSLASNNSRAASLVGVSMLSEKLASQQLTLEDAQPVADFFSILVGGAMQIVNEFASPTANSGNNGAAARALAAHDVFTSIVLSAAALTRGMSNKVACNGSVVSVVTPLFAASAQCMTADLVTSGGLTMSLLTPGSSGFSEYRLRLLLASDFSVNTPFTMSLNPVIGPLCAADGSCASAGFRVTITILIDTSLLIASLGGPAINLAANLSDYRYGGTVEIVSPVVRVAAPGLPFTAIGVLGLVTIGIPLNSTSVATKGAKTARAVVRLQDLGAAPVDVSAGISSSMSTTYITNTENLGISYNLMSFTSNNLGDFVVVQYDSTATPTSGASSSLPEMGSGSAGAAELAQQPCVFTACVLAIAAMIFAVVL
ncbi:hypothetical protein VaNZ11_010655 [Volvox africanus]|uniref:GPI-anchored surface protein n=1 Tax=Volvox africanus TaxID=51714 RepID=A0ABQ5SB77_9CHLO|nr:hypothetical protein VaNZ11_010655 [Volvox africanus]